MGSTTNSYDKTVSILNYYIDLKKFVYKLKIFDSKGIPLVRYPFNIGIQYNPVTCCQYALGNLQLYLSNYRKKFLDRFFKICEWLIDTSQDTGCGGVAWYYKYDNPWYPVKTPYLSCMSQGQAISVFVRAYMLTRELDYVDLAKKAFKVLQTPMEKKGVLYKDSVGIWLEETPTMPPSHILNGWIYAIFGVYDLFLATKSSEYKKFFDQCIITLKRAIPLYDNGYWSVYDLFFKYPSTSFYHKLHIQQLKTLHEITNVKIFNEIAKKFENYQKIKMYNFRSVLSRNFLSIKDIVRLYGPKSLVIRLKNKILFNNQLMQE